MTTPSARRQADPKYLSRKIFSAERHRASYCAHTWLTMPCPAAPSDVCRSPRTCKWAQWPKTRRQPWRGWMKYCNLATLHRACWRCHLEACCTRGDMCWNRPTSHTLYGCGGRAVAVRSCFCPKTWSKAPTKKKTVSGWEDGSWHMDKMNMHNVSANQSDEVRDATQDQGREHPEARLEDDPEDAASLLEHVNFWSIIWLVSMGTEQSYRRPCIKKSQNMFWRPEICSCICSWVDMVRTQDGSNSPGKNRKNA